MLSLINYRVAIGKIFASILEKEIERGGGRRRTGTGGGGKIRGKRQKEESDIYARLLTQPQRKHTGI